MEARKNRTLLLLALCLAPLATGCGSLEDFWNTPVSSPYRAKDDSSKKSRWKDSQEGQQYTRTMYSVGNMPE